MVAPVYTPPSRQPPQKEFYDTALRSRFQKHQHGGICPAAKCTPAAANRNRMHEGIGGKFASSTKNASTCPAGSICG